MDILLKDTQVFEIVGFKKTKLDKMIAAGEFPKPIKFGPRTRWKQSTIEAWIDALEAV
tara:strand:- start:683 stop:856 length:174 start_codon:yes stop_codon:yes gene_type:complete